MKLSKLLFWLFILCAATAHAAKFKYTEVQLKGSCPKIKYISNYNMARNVGWWYLAFSTINSPLCLNNEGQTMYATQYDDKIIHVEMCCRSAAAPETAYCGRKVGSGTVQAISNPGNFTYESDDKVYPVYVLDMDYESFNIVYGCKPGPNDEGRDEMLFVTSRSYQLNNTLVNRVRNVLRRNEINWTKAKPVKQGPTIPYIPGSKP